MLKAAVIAEGERVVAAALAGATDPEASPAQRHRAALALLDAVDPQVQVSAEVSLPASPDEVGEMGLEELQALAAQVHGTSQATPLRALHPGQ